MNWSPMSMNAIRVPCAAAELELEEAPVPGERFVDVADLQRDVVDADQARHAAALLVIRS